MLLLAPAVLALFVGLRSASASDASASARASSPPDGPSAADPSPHFFFDEPPPPVAVAAGAPVYVTVNVDVVEPPDASSTVIVIAFAPLARGIVALHDVVPVAVPLPPVAAFDQVTWLIPAADAAVPVTTSGDVAVDDGGAFTVTVGGGPPPPPPVV